jgi:hypothetical protein
MNRRNVNETALAIFVVAVLFVLLLIFRYWPTMEWAVLGIAAIVIGAVIANVIYAFVSLELGYSTDAEKPKRVRKRSHLTPQRLRALLHPRMLWHR